MPIVVDWYYSTNSASSFRTIHMTNEIHFFLIILLRHVSNDRFRTNSDTFYKLTFHTYIFEIIIIVFVISLIELFFFLGISFTLSLSSNIAFNYLLKRCVNKIVFQPVELVKLPIDRWFSWVFDKMTSQYWQYTSKYA